MILISTEEVNVPALKGHWYPLIVLSAGLQGSMAPKPRRNLAKELQEAQSHWQVHERQMSLIKY